MMHLTTIITCCYGNLINPSISMKKAIQVSIRGKVQGVGFRVSTLAKAKSLGLCGYVKNEPNGDVSAHFEGDSAQLEAMLDWCKQGPIRAKVSECTSQEVTPNHYTDFSIT